METNTQVKVRCIFCDAPLEDVPDDRGRLVDDGGWPTCPDGGNHRPVITVGALA